MFAQFFIETDDRKGFGGCYATFHLNFESERWNWKSLSENCARRCDLASLITPHLEDRWLNQFLPRSSWWALHKGMNSSFRSSNYLSQLASHKEEENPLKIPSLDRSQRGGSIWLRTAGGRLPTGKRHSIIAMNYRWWALSPSSPANHGWLLVLLVSTDINSLQKPHGHFPIWNTSGLVLIVVFRANRSDAVRENRFPRFSLSSLRDRKKMQLNWLRLRLHSIVAHSSLDMWFFHHGFMHKFIKFSDCNV